MAIQSDDLLVLQQTSSGDLHKATVAALLSGAITDVPSLQEVTNVGNSTTTDITAGSLIAGTGDTEITLDGTTGHLTGPNATLSGYMNAGGFPKGAQSNGAGVYSEGTFYASRGSTTANVYTAYTTGNNSPTINFTAGGDGAFTGKITSGETVSGDSSTTLTTKGYVMPLDISTLPELT